MKTLISKIRTAPVYISLLALTPILSYGETESSKDCMIQKLEALSVQQARAVSTFSHLPKPSSAAWKHFVSEIKSAFEQNRSYAIINTSKYFDEASVSSLIHSVPRKPGTNTQIVNNRIIATELDGNQVVSSTDASPAQATAINNVHDWLRALIAESLQNNVSLADTGSKHLRLASSEAHGVRFDDWHLDGGDKSAIIVLRGSGPDVLGTVPTTYYRADFEKLLGTKEFKRVPQGQTIIFTGFQPKDSHALGTVHRTPPVYDEDRAILIYRY